jgi:hypothetical protein
VPEVASCSVSGTPTQPLSTTTITVTSNLPNGSAHFYIIDGGTAAYPGPVATDASGTAVIVFTTLADAYASPIEVTATVYGPSSSSPARCSGWVYQTA